MMYKLDARVRVYFCLGSVYLISIDTVSTCLNLYQWVLLLVVVYVDVRGAIRVVRLRICIQLLRIRVSSV